MNWFGTTLIIAAGFAVWVFGTYLQIQEGSFSKGTFPTVELVVAVFATSVVLFLTIFSYASVSGKTLKFVWLFFSRHIIDIDSITDINDQGTFKIAKSQFRSLYVFYDDKSGDKKWIEFRITIFPEKTLGKLIKELKTINPHIKLNRYAEKLMQSVS